MLLDIVLWILFGALAGWIASKIMHTDAQMGAMANIAVGIIGAFIGGFLVRTLTGEAPEGFSITSHRWCGHLTCNCQSRYSRTRRSSIIT
jgi:uncharacterized membrane protein YeaQ/YmgE (transglycosylase-associated protein family)